MEKTLKEKVVSSSLWSLLGSSGYQILGLLIFIVLTRLLAPEDFGVAAVAIGIIEIINVIARMGTLELLIKDKQLMVTSRSTIFWFNLSIGLSLSLLIYFSSELLERLFDLNGLSSALELLAIIPTLFACSTVYEAELKRKFLFKKITIRILLTSTISGLVAIVLAIYDFGLFSLICMRLSASIIEIFLYYRVSPWLPSFKLDMNYLRSGINTASGVTFAALAGVFVLKLIEFSIAVILGAGALGYYKIASKLSDFVVQITVKPLADVSLPAFAVVATEIKLLKKTYLSFISMTLLFTLPAFTGLSIVAPFAVDVVFDSRWQGSASVLQVLCMAGFSFSLMYFFSPLMISLNKPWWIVKLRLGQMLLLVMMFIVFNIKNIEELLYVYIGSLLVMTILMQIICWKQLGIKWKEFQELLTLVSIPLISMTAAVLLINSIFNFESLAMLTLLVMTGAAVYALALLALVKMRIINASVLKELVKRKVSNGNT
jgi:O-antigen/teichoic acid export membrane protein